jgi:Tfp pilus assembly protein PilZ
MQVKPEVRKSERFGHELIIKFDDDRALSPYYALSQNLSERGMNFKSLFELYPGAHILVMIDDYELSRYQVPAKVVWCKKLKNTDRFRYGVGIEFLKLEKNFGAKATHPIIPKMKTPNLNRDGVVIEYGEALTRKKEDISWHQISE